jgi:phosphatidate cytidylyltransferase
MLLQLTRRTNDDALTAVAMTLWGVAYCAVLPGLTVHLRHLELSGGGWPMQGMEFAIVCIFVSKVSDVGALLTGSQWGRHKLIPRLSPGKTWEGAVGGLLFSIGLLQFMVWTNPAMALAQLGRPLLVLLSFLLAAGGLAGDLIESAFKRNSRMKDAGTGVPGFGGMLDLVDSLMVATPVMYIFLILCGARYTA